MTFCRGFRNEAFGDPHERTAPRSACARTARVGFAGGRRLRVTKAAQRQMAGRNLAAIGAEQAVSRQNQSQRFSSNCLRAGAFLTGDCGAAVRSPTAVALVLIFRATRATGASLGAGSPCVEGDSVAKKVRSSHGTGEISWQKELVPMNFFSNIWKHPKTSAAGLLIGVASVAGVLSQQGITLGKVGTGTVVSLASALATALLGLLAKDPDQGSGVSDQGSGSVQKLGAWMLIALLIPLPWMQGCTAKTAAQDIVNWTPALQSAVAMVDSTAAVLDPADAPIFVAATAGFDVASNLLVAQAQAYLANPSASKLAQLQSQIVTLQQQVNSALLQAVRIVDAKSQQHAMAAIEAVATVVTAILSVVQSISSKAQIAQMAAHSSVKIASIENYLDRTQAAQMVAAHYGEPVALARVQVALAEEAEVSAGF